VLIPKFIQIFKATKENLRKYALGAVNVFLFLMPQALTVNMDKYMEVGCSLLAAAATFADHVRSQGLFHLTRDPSKEIRKRVCQAFVILLEVRFDYLQRYIHDVIKFMLVASQDEDEIVALEACEFCTACFETCEWRANARPLLQARLPNVCSWSLAVSAVGDSRRAQGLSQVSGALRAQRHGLLGNGRGDA
jgi:transportin-1